MLEDLQLGGQRVAAGVAEDLQIRGRAICKACAKPPLGNFRGCQSAQDVDPLNFGSVFVKSKHVRVADPLKLYQAGLFHNTAPCVRVEHYPAPRNLQGAFCTPCGVANILIF